MDRKAQRETDVDDEEADEETDEDSEREKEDKKDREDVVEESDMAGAIKQPKAEQRMSGAVLIQSIRFDSSSDRGWSQSSRSLWELDRDSDSLLRNEAAKRRELRRNGRRE